MNSTVSTVSSTVSSGTSGSTHERVQCRVHHAVHHLFERAHELDLLQCALLELVQGHLNKVCQGNLETGAVVPWYDR